MFISPPPPPPTTVLKSLTRFLDSIPWLDSLARFLGSIPWFDSLARFLGSIPWLDSLARFLGSIPWFDSLARFLGSIPWLDSLARFLGSIPWLDSLARFLGSIPWLDSLARFLSSILWLDSLTRFLDSMNESRKSSCCVVSLSATTRWGRPSLIRSDESLWRNVIFSIKNLKNHNKVKVFVRFEPSRPPNHPLRMVWWCRYTYPTNKFGSRLWGALVLLGSSPTGSFTPFELAAHSRLSPFFLRGVHSIVRRLRTNPPRKINMRFFFLFLLPPTTFSYKWIESEWVWQAFFCNTRTVIAILKLQENCNGGGRVGRGPGRVIDIAIAIAEGCERDAQGIAVRVVEAMWSSVAIRAATIEKSSFRVLGRSSVEALGLRFWRLAPLDVQHRDRRCRSRFTDQSDALGKRRGRLGICRARQILVSGRTSKSLWGLESTSWTQPPERHNDETWRDWATSLCSRTHARFLVGAR